MNKFILEPLTFIKWVVLSLVGVLMVQTFLIQVVNQKALQSKTKEMAVRSKNIYAERGQILDRNGVVLADNYRDTANKVLDYSRIFLQGKLASQVVGKLDFNGHGNMGMERVFDSSLTGVEGFRVSVQDVRHREIYSRSEDVAQVQPGKSLVLTIDRNMQEIVEKELKNGVAEFMAKSASAVVVDPYTGEILAMASYPTFDPNSKTQGVGRMAKNEIVALAYEPGSTFKVITASAALENGVVDTNKVYQDEGKCWKWNPKVKPICDTHVYGDMNMSEAMVQSSNVVFAKIATEVGPEKLYRMARNYGIGMKTSEFFYGEESGSLKDPYSLSINSGSDLKSMGFGHAVMATPIQMVMAYSAVANGGKLMEPMIVKEWRDSEGNVLEKKEPVEVRRVISESTAAMIRPMLSRVVNNGTAKKVMSKKIPDLIFGGKTGTAEKYNHETGKYDTEHQMASFIGLAPVENVRYVCMVIVDDPQTAQHHGGNTAGPIFRRIMEGVYYHPALSPLTHNLAQVSKKSSCDVDFMGMTVEAAKKVAESKNCHVEMSGSGERVIAQRNDVMDSVGVMLTLGEAVATKMPDLKGLSLKDALEVMGNIRVNVEYTGKGRVVSQSPSADEVLKKGTICKLTLKERG